MKDKNYFPVLLFFDIVTRLTLHYFHKNQYMALSLADIPWKTNWTTKQTKKTTILATCDKSSARAPIWWLENMQKGVKSVLW